MASEASIVDIRSVDKELTRLWRETAEGGLSGVSAPVTRVLLANLLVYALTDDEADEAQAVIADMAAEYPTRTVITDAQPDAAKEKLDAGISVLCDINERGARLCGESIRLHVHDIDESSLGTIIPLLVPDLPIYLWTPGDIATDQEALRRLARFSDHWIIDSRVFSHWPSKLGFANSLTSEAGVCPHLHDLAWGSLYQWREAIAQAYDSPSARAYLAGVKSVAIEYSLQTGDGPAVEAVMLAGWMMRQLGWTLSSFKKKSKSWIIEVNSTDAPLTITLHPTRNGSRPLPITQVTIQSEVDGRNAEIRSAAVPESEELTTQVDAPDLPGIRRTLRLASPSRCRAVCQALDAPGSDRLYQQVLPTILALAKAIDEVR
jgi:glucose-6-phosphate dehydrogenase assembly protein OpcA